MAIRKLLLPLTGTAAGEAALATALTIARAWNAHVTANLVTTTYPSASTVWWILIFWP